MIGGMRVTEPGTICMIGREEERKRGREETGEEEEVDGGEHA